MVHIFYVLVYGYLICSQIQWIKGDLNTYYIFFIQEPSDSIINPQKTLNVQAIWQVSWENVLTLRLDVPLHIMGGPSSHWSFQTLYPYLGIEFTLSPCKIGISMVPLHYGQSSLFLPRMSYQNQDFTAIISKNLTERNLVKDILACSAPLKVDNLWNGTQSLLFSILLVSRIIDLQVNSSFCHF